MILNLATAYPAVETTPAAERILEAQGAGAFPPTFWAVSSMLANSKKAFSAYLRGP